MFTRARDVAPAPVFEVEVDVQAARDELRAAEIAVLAANGAYSAALLSSDDIGLRARDDARRDAARRMDRAQALMAALDERLSVAREPERRAELAHVIEAAVAAQGEFREIVERDLPEISAMAGLILAAKADAERLTKIANRAIAEAGEGEPLPGVEAFQALPGRPREELSRETVDLWVHDDGTASGHQDKIRTRGDGAGSLMLPQAHHLRLFTKRRLFEVVTYMPAGPGVIPPALDAALSVPDLYPSTSQAQDRRPVTEMRP